MIRILKTGYDEDVPFHPDIIDFPHVAEVIRGERKFRYTERLFRRSESLQTQYYNNIYRKKQNKIRL